MNQRWVNKFVTTVRINSTSDQNQNKNRMSYCKHKCGQYSVTTIGRTRKYIKTDIVYNFNGNYAARKQLSKVKFTDYRTHHCDEQQQDDSYKKYDY